MRVRIRGGSSLVALVGAVVLVLGSVLFAASATAVTTHTQGTQQAKANDRAQERHQPATGGGHTYGSAATRQGRSAVRLDKPNHYQSQADPDGMGNGGVDQPGGTGGVNRAAQDGNNGSGNDIDCEDDNRGKGVPGHCKDRPAGCDQPGNGHGHGYGRQCEEAPNPVRDEEPVAWLGIGDAISPLAGSSAGGSGQGLPVDPMTVLGFAGMQHATGADSAAVPQSLGLEAFVAAGFAAPTVAATNTVAHDGVEVPTVVDAGVLGSAMSKVLPNTGAGKALFVLALAGVAALAAAVGLRNRQGGGVAR